MQVSLPELQLRVFFCRTGCWPGNEAGWNQDQVFEDSIHGFAVNPDDCMDDFFAGRARSAVL